MHPDFNRNVYCILGLPFDAVTMTEAVQQVRDAAENCSPFFLTTPNLNFLIGCQSDTAFRNSVINSNLSVADGMPIVWIAKLLGIPIRERVAGSDLFESLKINAVKPLSVYFFGGLEGVAETACTRLNDTTSGILCAGCESPGFASVQEMSSQKTIDKINASGADFLLVSLGAKKGQAWIEHNRNQISVPVISHLGAVINFVAGNLDRAPILVRRLGLEWLWRIKEEPSLWRRYASDGRELLKLILTRILPYAWFLLRHKPANHKKDNSTITLSDDNGITTIHLSGIWVMENLHPLRECFANQVLTDRNIQIDLKNVIYIDSGFMGLLLMLYGKKLQQSKYLSVRNSQQPVREIFYFMCVEFLLD